GGSSAPRPLALGDLLRIEVVDQGWSAIRFPSPENSLSPEGSPLSGALRHRRTAGAWSSSACSPAEDGAAAHAGEAVPSGARSPPSPGGPSLGSRTSLTHRAALDRFRLRHFPLSGLARM
ncbi:hypothetical protein ACFQ08_22225, partial [Streptosporangium algeriense]